MADLAPHPGVFDARPPLTDDPLNLGPDWFNTLFAHLGLTGTVTKVASRAIGSGQIGTNVRFDLSFADGGGTTPRSLVGKFPSYNATSRQAALMLGHYGREVNFYRTFEHTAARIAPRALYTDFDPGTNLFVLLMEDMAPAEQGDQLTGCGLAHAELAMDAAAILHASHWDDPALDAYPWLQSSKAAPVEPIDPDRAGALWSGFKDRYAGRISAEAEAIGDQYVAALHGWAEGYDGPRCLTHADFRLDNMLFGGSERALAVVDWQTPGVRGPLIDVAYFLGAGLLPEVGREHEKALVRRYHDRLVAEGVGGYGFEDAWRDYRWFSFYGMQVAFGAAMLVEQTPRGDEMFLTMLHRHADQVRRLDATALLP